MISLFLSFFIVTASVLQGLNKQYYTVISMVVGFLVKIILAKPFIIMFEEQGTSYSTMIGLSISILLNIIIKLLVFHIKN